MTMTALKNANADEPRLDLQLAPLFPIAKPEMDKSG